MAAAAASGPLGPMHLWEHILDKASAETQIWHVSFKQRQWQQRHTLWLAVKGARATLRQHPQDQHLTELLLQAEQLLTEYDTAAAQQRIAATEPLWEMYGESSTYWFHRLGRQPRESQLIATLQQPGDDQSVHLTTGAGVAAAGELLADYYDSATGGIFAAAATDPAAQQEMLAAVDKQLSAAEQQRCEGTAGDGSITLGEASAVLSNLPRGKAFFSRGKAPGSDGLTYEFYIAF